MAYRGFLSMTVAYAGISQWPARGPIYGPIRLGYVPPGWWWTPHSCIPLSVVCVAWLTTVYHFHIEPVNCEIFHTRHELPTNLMILFIILLFGAWTAICLATVCYRLKMSRWQRLAGVKMVRTYVLLGMVSKMTIFVTKMAQLARLLRYSYWLDRGKLRITSGKHMF